MNWTDDAFLLDVRPHGETAVIATLLTREHGKHDGLVHGGRGRKMRGSLQKGNRLSAAWQARLNEHLGTWTLELQDDVAGKNLLNGFALEAIAALTSVLSQCLNDRDPAPDVYDASLVLLDSLESPEVFAQLYFRWELGLLAGAGFPLDLTACAVTGQSEELVYISPKSGKAVSRDAGAPYSDKLFTLPPSLLATDISPELPEIMSILRITSHFLDKHLLAPRNRALPAARARFVDRLGRMARMEAD